MADSSPIDAIAEGECPEGPPPDAPSATLPLRRACEACRSRKIRCDRNCPCSHCIQANIPCTKAVRSTRENRSRMSMSAKYEQKIDIIDRRLEAVTQILHELQTNSSSPVAHSATSVSPAAHRNDTADTALMASSSTPFGDTSQPATADTPVVEGESSFAAHSAFANSFLQKAVHNDPLRNLDLDMKETVDPLHCNLVALKQQTAKTEMSYPFAKPTLRPSLRGSKLPPIEKAVALIRGAKANIFESSAWIYDLFPMGYFSDICLRVYFSEDFSDSDYIIANSGLLQLFLEQSEFVPGDKAESLNYAHICRINLETALVNLPLHSPATSNMISALLLGAFHTIEISKPSLCWTLSSKASELCQTLGYHRISSAGDGTVADEMRHEQFLFWFTYFIDKSLSLRLGRASAIQDWDITTPMLPVDGNCSLTAATIAMWVSTARCQGKIYESLYSPDSIAQPDHIRESRVQALSSDLYELARKAREIRDNHLQKARDTFGNRLVEYIALSDDVLRLSLLTLVYRASPTPPGSQSAFIPDCVEAARATLQRHQDFLTTFKDLTSPYFITYIHWTLLFAPFTPFIVLFCHIIEAPRGEEDLTCLRDFVTSIESAPTLSDAASKMHRLFEVLYKVALRYIEYRSSTSSGGQTQVDELAALNAHLTALGFPPMNQDNCQQQSTDFSSVPGQDVNFQQVMGSDFNALAGVDGQRGIHPTAWIGHTTELGEWFEGNQHMMDLLEEPSFTFSQQNQ